VPVYLINDDIPGADRFVENLAQMFTARIFADIGVKIDWQSRPPHGLRIDHSILITVTARAPKTSSLHTLATAEPFGINQIAVFFGRITARQSLKSAAILFAYVMAHEITHVLEGIDHHAPRGIMRSHWDADDFAKMEMRELTFTTHDVHLIKYRPGFVGCVAAS
jgi:hypothetical protein